DALEAVGPLTLDPVHHEAAVGCAEGADALSIQPRILLECRLQAGFQVLQGLAAPVACDGVREGLAVTGRAVEIDEHHAIAGAGKGLRIPPVTPSVAEASLRSAVYQEGHGIFAVLLEIRRLDDVAEHVVVTGPGEVELCVFGQLALLQRGL